VRKVSIFACDLNAKWKPVRAKIYWGKIQLNLKYSSIYKNKTDLGLNCEKELGT